MNTKRPQNMTHTDLTSIIIITATFEQIKLQVCRNRLTNLVRQHNVAETNVAKQSSTWFSVHILSIYMSFFSLHYFVLGIFLNFLLQTQTSWYKPVQMQLQDKAFS